MYTINLIKIRYIFNTNNKRNKITETIAQYFIPDLVKVTVFVVKTSWQSGLNFYFDQFEFYCWDF